MKRAFSPFRRIPLAFGVIAPLGLVGIALTFLSTVHRRWRDGAVAFAIVPLAILMGWTALGLALKSRDDQLLVRYIDHYNLGTGYEIKGLYAKAIDEYEAALKRAPFDLKVVESLQGNIKMLQERIDSHAP